jgi:hypothetical protein
MQHSGIAYCIVQIERGMETEQRERKINYL